MIKFKSHNNFNYYYDENTGSLNSVPNDTIVQEKSNVINTICKKEISEKDIIYQIINSPYIVFEVTEKCNLQCKYCVYSNCYDGHTKRFGKDMSAKDAIAIIDFVCSNTEKYNVGSLKIDLGFYGGEPLIRFAFIKEVIEYTKNRWTHFALSVHMTTNATLLTEEIMNYLDENNIKLLISLDGNEYNHSYRVYKKDGSNSFDDVIKKVDLLRDKHPDYFLRKVNFNSVLHNRNSTKEATDFIFQKYNKKTMLSELVIDGVKNEYKREFIEMFKNTLDGLSSEDYSIIFDKDNYSQLPSFKEAIYFIYNETPFVYGNYIDLLFDKPRIWKPTGTCLPFGRKLFVASNGNIFPCENVPHRMPFGRVEKGELKMNLKEIAEKYNELLSIVSAQCEKCYRKFNCNQCVFFLKPEKNYRCQGFINKQTYSIYLENLINYFEDTPDSFVKIMEDVSLS